MQLRHELSDLTKICEGQQGLIADLEAALGEAKHNVRVVKDVGDSAIGTLNDTLRTTLEKMRYYEEMETEYTTAGEDLQTVRDENLDLKSMVHSLQLVLKQQTEALAEKERQIMRTVHAGRTSPAPETPPHYPRTSPN